MGVVSNKLWFPNKVPTWWPDKLHWWLGRAVACLAIANLFLGLPLAAGSVEAVPVAAWALMGTWLVVTLLAAGFLEVNIGQQSVGTTHSVVVRWRNVPRLTIAQAWFFDLHPLNRPQENHSHYLLNGSEPEKPLLGERIQNRVSPPLVYGAVGYLLFCNAVLVGVLVVIA